MGLAFSGDEGCVSRFAALGGNCFAITCASPSPRTKDHPILVKSRENGFHVASNPDAQTVDRGNG
jgi:hypothetical protein